MRKTVLIPWERVQSVAVVSPRWNVGSQWHKRNANLAVHLDGRAIQVLDKSLTSLDTELWKRTTKDYALILRTNGLVRGGSHEIFGDYLGNYVAREKLDAETRKGLSIKYSDEEANALEKEDNRTVNIQCRPFRALTTLFGPTGINLKKQGLTFEFFGFIEGPVIPWSKVAYVQITDGWGPLRKVKWIDFRVFVRDMDPDDYLFYTGFLTQFWIGGNVVSIPLDLFGLDYEGQAQKLLTALAKRLTPEKLQPRLVETLKPQHETSYTSIWMDTLNASTQRMRTEPLVAWQKVGEDKYTIVEQIGAGGQGIAYLATTGDKFVVLKEFILPAHGGAQAQARSLDNIQREADLLKRIAHPQIVSLLDFFVEDQRAYLVLDHIKGESLRNLVESKGPLPEERIIPLAVQLSNILEHLHQQTPPVIHRDFTPENIIVGVDGIARLIDFNVAQQRESTSTRTVVGKHSYIPPEQFRGKATTQSDIYALGGTLHFVATGQDPEPITPSHPRDLQPEISQRLDTIVARATQTSTTDRYTTAQEIKEDLLR